MALWSSTERCQLTVPGHKTIPNKSVELISGKVCLLAALRQDRNGAMAPRRRHATAAPAAVEAHKLVAEAEHAGSELMQQRSEGAESEGEGDEGLTEYERQRNELIQRNRQRLVDLGLLEAVKGLSELLVATK